ncbi:MAG: L,D-transpeptidase family protein, partial [Proteobacteria bacterium]|nr:L,D-transpeptidase family protein [Pseudomonadota bacterium]
HNSNIYDEASMPFMQRITWSGVALHEGVVPGYRASHGCIRMPSGFAEQLFRTTKIGMRVLIVPKDATPMPISHPALFQPGVPQAKAASGGGDKARVEQVAAIASDVQLAALPSTPDAPREGIADFNAKRAAAEARLATATAAANDAKRLVRPRMIELGAAEKVARQTTALVRRAEGRVEALGRSVSAARTPDTTETAVSAHIDGLIELAQVRGREDMAKELAGQKAAVVTELQERVKALEAERTDAQVELRTIQRRLSPVTVFVSRSLGRVYVRQSFQPVLDLPIAIRDPGRPIGTHVFTAFAPKDGSGGVDWVGVTVDTGTNQAADDEEPRKSSRKRHAEKSQQTSHEVVAMQAARDALDRIELPQEVLARVMPSLSPGSSVIISDLGPSIETGQGTDIVVQTRGEEEAKKSIAAFVARKKAEERGEYYSRNRPGRSREWSDDDDDDRPRNRRGSGRGGWGWW